MRSLPLTLILSLSAHAGVAATFFLASRVSEPEEPALSTSGETFELPAPETEDVPLANASPSPESASPPAEAEGEAPAHLTPRAHRAPKAERTSRIGRPSGGRSDPGEEDGVGSGPAKLYGAVGERSATDLATAFTRGFPQAASADPMWRSASMGSAGDAVVILTLDESGHLEATQTTGNPSPALTSAIRRTLSLIKSRPFVAKGRVTKLHLSATVSKDTVHDGLHGDVFAIGGSFAAGEGSAFFALAIGRRIDVRVRLK